MRMMSAILALLGFCVESLADGADSIQVKPSVRNVMLNAESATAPRVLNIGLPEAEGGSVVFIDGMKAGQGLPRSYFHWAGGNAYLKTSSFSLMESVIRTGEISTPVNSWTKLGDDSRRRVITVRTSTNGLVRFDGFAGGPVKNRKGWYYSLGAYVNLDPSSVNAPSCPFVDRKQIYQGTLSRRWSRSSLDLLYRFSWCGDQIEGLYNTAPFIYNGDGSVTAFNGFRMGCDCYFPADDAVHYMDLVTGEMKEVSLSRVNDRRFHDLSLLWKTVTETEWMIRASAHLLLMPRYRQAKGTLAGTDYVSLDQGFTLSDGEPFQGYVQNRLISIEEYKTTDGELLLEAEKTFGRNDIKSGLSLTFADQYEATSSFTFAHTAETSPERIHYGSRDVWNLNRNSLYFDGLKLCAAAFIFDRWTVSEKVCLVTGIRIKPQYNPLNTAAQMDGEEKNVRVEGFNLADPALAELHHLDHKGIDYAVSESLDWAFAPGFKSIVEGFFSKTCKNSTYFKNATIPSLTPIGNAYVRAGVVYANAWMNLAGTVSYITSWNNATSISVTKQIAGISETIPWVAQYGIRTPGVTLDGNVFLDGFSCHTFLTWQDPRYRDYYNDFLFTDGTTQTISYNGNQVTGISKLMVECDPSYRWRSWRAWCSFRYFSRRYASRTNHLYFNGRMETFGGIDWDWHKGCTVSISCVNILGQGGVKGTVDLADTIDNPSALEGYVMAGTFIRPFSLDFSLTLNF